MAVPRQLSGVGVQIRLAHVGEEGAAGGSLLGQELPRKKGSLGALGDVRGWTESEGLATIHKRKG